MSHLQRKLRQALRKSPPSPPVPIAAVVDLLEAQRLADAERQLPKAEPRGIPQIIITLAPSGADLQAELPGANGSRRVVALRGKDFYDSCLRMLQAQARREIEIGLDGAPTQAQVKHWERHQTFPDPMCRFCIAEGRAFGKRRAARARPLPVGDGSVTVRRLAPKGQRQAARPERKLRITASLSDLDL